MIDDGFFLLLAFLVRMEGSSLMDHKPEDLVAEVEKVDTEGYVESLTENEKRRYNAYIEFYHLRKETDMSEEEKVAAPESAPAEVPAEPAAPVAE